MSITTAAPQRVDTSEAAEIHKQLREQLIGRIAFTPWAEGDPDVKPRGVNHGQSPYIRYGPRFVVVVPDAELLPTKLTGRTLGLVWTATLARWDNGVATYEVSDDPE